MNWKTHHIGGNAIISSPVLFCHVWKDKNVALEQQTLWEDVSEMVILGMVVMAMVMKIEFFE